MLHLDTSIDSYLTNIIKPHFNFSQEYVCSKDSRDIDAGDRSKLVEMIRATQHANILITHGTYTMAKTVDFLEKTELADDKVVIITGSMIPIVGFSASDAGFNLGYAISAFNYLEPGIYLIMNGGVFSAKEVQKNTEKLRFE